MAVAAEFSSVAGTFLVIAEHFLVIAELFSHRVRIFSLVVRAFLHGVADFSQVAGAMPCLIEAAATIAGDRSTTLAAL